MESVAAEVLLPAGGVVRTQTLLEAARRVCREHARIPIVCRISTFQFLVSTSTFTSRCESRELRQQRLRSRCADVEGGALDADPLVVLPHISAVAVGFRIALLRAFGAKIGRDVVIRTTANAPAAHVLGSGTGTNVGTISPSISGAQVAVPRNVVPESE